MGKKIFIVSLFLTFVCQTAFAYLRPLGLGGAFTAVSDDANAPYWNPAGLALNPEVSLTVSTKLNNRNTYVGDNVVNLKLCYDAEMTPFEWITGVGAASLLAFEGARYLSDRGSLKTGWGREGKKTAREESMAAQVKGTVEVVSLKQAVKEAVKALIPRPRFNSFFNWYLPWYRPSYHQPHYWEVRESGSGTKGQFALGFSLINDYNARPTVDQNLNLYSLSLASGFEQRVAVGGNLNVYNLEKISTGLRGLGADLDLGAIVKPVEYISFGVVTKGILTTDIKWQTSETTRNELLVNAGLAIKPIYSLTLAADIHNVFYQNGKNPTYHYGAESVLLPGLLVRAGLSDGSKTAGLSLAVGNLILDYALLGGRYNRTHLLGLAWRF